MEELKEVRLRYMQLTPEELATLMISPRCEQLKLQALAKMKIRRRKDESPLDAWLRSISRLNKVRHTKPVHNRIADAISMNKEAARFMWFLA